MQHISPSPAQQNLREPALDWTRERLARGEAMASSQRSDSQDMASDSGITQTDLIDIVPHSADHTNLMNQMMPARGLAPDKVRHAFAPLVRAMELICNRCQSAGRCQRDLVAGTAAENCHDYCENAETIDDLLAINKVPLVP